jgi:hypothetical protein
VGITFSRISSSYWIDNLGFLLREKLAAISITPCSWGFQLAGHLFHQLHANKFSGTIHHRAISASDKWGLILIPSVGGRIRKQKKFEDLFTKPSSLAPATRGSTWQFSIG